MNNNNTLSLAGTSWSLQGTNYNNQSFSFLADGTAELKVSDELSVKFYWWQKGTAYWAQEVEPEAGYFTLHEGHITSDSEAVGSSLVGQKGVAFMLSEAYKMSKDG